MEEVVSLMKIKAIRRLQVIKKMENTMQRKLFQEFVNGEIGVVDLTNQLARAEYLLNEMRKRQS